MQTGTVAPTIRYLSDTMNDEDVRQEIVEVRRIIEEQKDVQESKAAEQAAQNPRADEDDDRAPEEGAGWADARGVSHG